MDLCIKPFSDLNPDDSFFDSLKASYPEFKEWFQKKAEAREQAYVFFDETEKIVDFLYLKIETEELKDVTPVLPAKKRLKVGTFKILQRHTLRGERFMKKIMDCAIDADVDEIYVTIFPTEKLEYLIKSFENYGFKHIADKNHNERGSEWVLVKDMRCHQDDVQLNYPFVRTSNVGKYLLAIKPEYHTRLFPDSILKTENPYDLVQDISETNSIHKIYICWMQDVDSLKRGDLLLIYRTTDGLGSANYRSVVTSVCTVNEVKIYNDFANEDEFVKYANKYSVFSENDLRYWYRNRKGFTVVKMLYNVAFTKRVIKQKLVETAGMNPNEYWGFRCVTDKQFDTTIKLGAVNERYFID